MLFVGGVYTNYISQYGMAALQDKISKHARLREVCCPDPAAVALYDAMVKKYEILELA